MKIKKELENVTRILVFNPSFIGDSILTTPLVKSLKELFPKAIIDFCVRPESSPLFKDIFNVIEFDKRNEHRGVKGIVKFTKILQNNNYDFVITAHKSIRSTLILKMTGAKIYGFTEGAFSCMYEGRVSRDIKLHEIERNLSLLSLITEDFDLDQAKRKWGKPKTYLDKKFYSRFKKCLYLSNRSVVSVNAGSAWETKRWPVNYFAEVCYDLFNTGAGILLIGGPNDVKVNSELKILLNEKKVQYCDLTGRVNFSKIPAIIKSSELLITNDSSPMHIAVSQDIPTVAIFGATTPSLGFAPYDDKSKICEIDLECRPCGLHGGNECPKRHFRCMRELTPEKVISKVKEIMFK